MKNANLALGLVSTLATVLLVAPYSWADMPSQIMTGSTIAPAPYPQYEVRLTGYSDWLHSCGLAFSYLGERSESLINLGQQFCASLEKRTSSRIAWYDLDGQIILNNLELYLQKSPPLDIKIASECVYLGALVDLRSFDKAGQVMVNIRAKGSAVP